MKAKRRRMRAAERLLFALYIYPHYTLGSRGPAGCVFDALQAIAPKIAKRLQDGDDPHDIYRDHFSEEGGLLS